MRMRRIVFSLFVLCTVLLGASTFTQRQREFWSFQRVKTQTPPVVKHTKWVRTPIDSFIAAKLESKGIEPALPAAKIALLRRATFDLTGLPPTSEEVDAYLADNSPQAFERVVDRLLASPQYGERWGRHWLDLARYAESEGFKADETRPNAWPYRDWVIRALNADLAFDQFVKWQIAGDEYEPNNPDAVTATGFLTAGPS